MDSEKWEEGIYREGWSKSMEDNRIVGRKKNGEEIVEEKSRKRKILNIVVLRSWGEVGVDVGNMVLGEKGIGKGGEKSEDGRRRVRFGKGEVEIVGILEEKGKNEKKFWEERKGDIKWLNEEREGKLGNGKKVEIIGERIGRILRIVVMGGKGGEEREEDKWLWRKRKIGENGKKKVDLKKENGIKEKMDRSWEGWEGGGKSDRKEESEKRMRKEIWDIKEMSGVEERIMKREKEGLKKKMIDRRELVIEDRIEREKDFKVEIERRGWKKER